jgi:hypothetical protein
VATRFNSIPVDGADRYGEAVTPQDRQVIYDLVFVPGQGRKGSPEDVLRHFETTDGHALGLRLLRDAVDRQDGIDAEAALIASGVFRITEDHLELLVRLASADWHRAVAVPVAAFLAGPFRRRLIQAGLHLTLGQELACWL